MAERIAGPDDTAPAGLSRAQLHEVYEYLQSTRQVEETLTHSTDRTRSSAGCADSPVPYSPPLKDYFLPRMDDIVAGCR